MESLGNSGAKESADDDVIDLNTLDEDDAPDAF
jgi:hypothetical protein